MSSRRATERVEAPLRKVIRYLRLSPSARLVLKVYLAASNTMMVWHHHGGAPSWRGHHHSVTALLVGYHHSVTALLVGYHHGGSPSWCGRHHGVVTIIA
ncbi:MAG: hypothetical protein K0U36_06460 [Alphaproteobacteria bacterium]|nr:hypothetical protein [Alphaproteobacteria bacterium]